MCVGKKNAWHSNHVTQLTIVTFVKDDELLPIELWHKGQQDVIDSNRRTGSQSVALAIRAGVELAYSSGCTIAISLDEEMRNVHCICQWLQGTGCCAPGGCDQSEDPLVHQLTCWIDVEKYRKENNQFHREGGNWKLDSKKCLWNIFTHWCKSKSANQCWLKLETHACNVWVGS